MIATHVCHYEHGDLVGQQYFDAAGTELDSNGRPPPPRPPGVPPLAFCINDQGWFWSRRSGENGDGRIESREWFPTGELRRECNDVTGAERSYYESGVLRVEGSRNVTGNSRHLIGEWRHYDREGRLYYIATYDPALASNRHVRDAWFHGSHTREGAVDRGVEIGLWTVDGNPLDLGARFDDAQLLDHAVCADELDDYPLDHSLPGMLARARRGELAYEGPAWGDFDDDGTPIALAHRPSTNLELVARVQALRWGPPNAGLLAAIADVLFRHDRAGAALDIIETAIALQPDPAWDRARACYLRALGRADEAERAVDRPERLDQRALELLDEIRANPGDDAPRLVFADHIAGRFPAHAALIVAQLQGQTDRVLEDAFRATLPAWIQGMGTIERGFFDDLRYAHAEELVSCDPDVHYRIAPTTTSIDLSYASDHIATLVTMPSLRRFRELAFSDTYLWSIHIEQLANCPYFDRLEHLSLYNCGLGDEDLETLARSTAFPKLTSLDLTNGREGQDYTITGVRALTTARFAPILESLAMQRRWLGDDIIEVVARFPELHHLDLSSNSLTDAAVDGLLAMELTSLTVAYNDFSEAGKRALLERFGERVTL